MKLKLIECAVGTSVGSIKKITPAEELVREIESEAFAVLDKFSWLRE